MINFFKSGWRNTYRNKTFSVINILGLAVGLAGFILMLLYLNYEKSYDNWHPALNKVYAVELQGEDGIKWNGYTPAILGEFLQENISGIEASTRISSSGDYEVLLEANGKKLYQKGLVEVDSSFFNVFPYEIIMGDPSTVMNAPNAMVISENLAEKYFGATNPIGETVKLYGALEGVITGVMKSPESPSYLNTQLVFRSPWEKQNNHWQNFSFQTFIKYSNQIALEDLDTKINEVYVQTHLQKKGSDYEKYMASPTSETLFSERFTDLHTNPKSGDSNLPVINILLILAASLLLAGAINFSNLSLAASISKAKEIGVRKILGSANLQLFWKFFMDIFFQIILSVIIATLLVVLMLPWFKTVFNISFNLLQGSLLWVFAQILCILLAVATLSGLYPSIVASRYNPIQVLKGQTKQKVGSMGLRNVLIIGQFVLSGFFIVCSVVIYKQVSFMQDKDKGFNDEQVIRIQTTQNTREQNFDLTREKLLAIAGISSVSKTTTVPGDKYIDTTSNRLLWDAKTLRFNEVKISTDYFKTLDAKLISGRWLDNRYNDQHTRSTIINETAAKQMGLENPVGQVLRFQHCDTVPIEIVGVIKDFQVEGVNRPIQSTMFLIGNEACSYLSGGAIIARLSSGNPKNTLAQIENVWKTIEPDFPMRYSFLNENFQKLYAEYLRIQKVVGYFTIVALLIAVMGLFALSAFLIKQRTKELGIRKVLGASALDIFKAVSGRFILYVTIATAIAIPLGWIASSRWLQNFAYKYEINWLIFIASASILLITAIITVGLQAVKAMRENPILSLRNE